MRGEDVAELQKGLQAAGITNIDVDGIFGRNTEAAVRQFQITQGLNPNGSVDIVTWTMLMDSGKTGELLLQLKHFLNVLTSNHGYRDSIEWSLTPQGISIDDNIPEYSSGEPKTVTRVWTSLRDPLVKWSTYYGVPVELIIATICTESGGNLQIKAREEPHYVSDEETPHRVSPGIMQTLISTARTALKGGAEINRAWLEQPENSIQAGTAYIASQRQLTNYDPPKVACAYNAGDIYYNDSGKNRWKMRQYPIGTDAHANRFVVWFNDCFRVFAGEAEPPPISFYKEMKHQLVLQPS